jgi:hypothetical protein
MVRHYTLMVAAALVCASGVPTLSLARAQQPHPTAQGPIASAELSPTLLAPARERLVTDLRARVDALAVESLQALTRKVGPGDTQWFDGSTWQYPGATVPFSLGPGVLAAAVYADNGRSQPRFLRLAERTFNVALDRHFDSQSGAFGDPRGLDTYFFAGELAAAYAYLEPSLGHDTQERWKAALGRIGHRLAATADTWYVNGNINLGEAEFFYALWKITGDSRWHDVYEASMRFTLRPNAHQWPGFGLQYTRRPTRDDCANGAGYLAEKGAGAPGYDAAYTTGQVEIASRLYLESGDARALCLVNLFTNKLLARTDASWALDARSGSRLSFRGQFVGSAPVVLALFAGRSGLARRLERLYTAAYSTFRGNAAQNWSSTAIYYDYGFSLATLHQAVSRAAFGIGGGTSGVEPEAPSAPVVKATSPAGLILTWTHEDKVGSAATSYRVLVDGAVAAVTAGPAALVRRPKGQNHTVRIVACDAWGHASKPSVSLKL